MNVLLALIAATCALSAGVAVGVAVAQRRRAARRIAELERANAGLERFCCVAAHDLAEPLRMVSGYLGLLERRHRGRLDADADRFIGAAVGGAERMRVLIEALRRDAGCGRAPAVTQVDCAATVAGTLSALEPALREAGAHVDVGRLPTVAADPGQLAQLFQNLIANAVKFRAPGREARVAVDAERTDGGWSFRVCDNGIGVAPGDADRIFTMYQRGERSGEYAGTGIGLAVCRRIVERHGGRIWVEATPGGGSAFRFTLAAPL